MVATHINLQIPEEFLSHDCSQISKLICILEPVLGLEISDVKHLWLIQTYIQFQVISSD